ncbi:uncharacterized protein KGF55_000128 [Candida pseudojiufengensis]|uniref:uncharacterized protein n=1 Tax=Candida pseudojiufengensis TaxID=497109 RepID=UPI002225984C|nr:uncharacterized protein KGF55_000128 [Candida pseudojiufengensis]KAI5966719.1 hypothetical protein KGF55_000128 [Candida pseudojiufengensis]
MSDLNVFVTSDLTSSERRISPQWNLKYLKQKLEQITGIEPQNQLIQYFPNKYSNEFIKITTQPNENDEDVLLSSINIKNYSRIHIIDLDPNSTTNQISSVISPSVQNQQEEFKLSEEEYQKRQDSVLSWKQSQKLGRFDPDYEILQKKIEKENQEQLSKIKVGLRCRVINIEGERRGTVKFVGKIEDLDQSKNDWVGIEFDEPVGKNNGDIDGIQIFVCKPKHGSFVKPKQVEVGDFPEIDPFDEDDDEDMDEEL